MQKVRVRLKRKTDESYDIVIGRNLLKFIARDLKKKAYGNSYAVVTDSKVGKLFSRKLIREMRKQGLKTFTYQFPAGEKSKNLSVAERICNKMLVDGFDRKSAVIAFGGGVVGDIAGFVAASYMRGIPFVQVPTTLLAMVDSSIGGKTGVNLAKGKNSFGAFHQPKKVYADTAFLDSLPEKEFRNAMAEIIKHAVITSRPYFSFLSGNSGKLSSGNRRLVTKMIRRSCRTKAAVVGDDVKEANFRQVLNYGHTVGHAIEVATNYKKYSHGQAVAIGMYAEARLSNALGLISEKEVEEIRKLLNDYGLKHSLPKISAKRLVREMRKDKKAVGGRILFALPKAIGKMASRDRSYGIEVKAGRVLRLLKSLRR